jgi:hypothetical protein
VAFGALGGDYLPELPFGISFTHLSMTKLLVLDVLLLLEIDNTVILHNT